MAPVAPSAPCIVLDLSRLVYAAWFRTPTGIPRVELAYAEYFAAHHPQRLRFVVVDALGRFRFVDNRLAMAFIRRIAGYWRGDILSGRTHAALGAMAHLIHAWLLVRPGIGLERLADRDDCIYIIPSQLHLEKRSAIERLKRSGKLRLVYVVHDILPSLLPEYFPPDAEARNRRRMETAARLADLIVTNSRATAEAFEARFGHALPAGSLVAAPIGVTVPATPGQDAGRPDRPYFVTVGTLEPRKNHLLLLNLWRTLRAELGEATPALVLVGGRGWENENVLDMLDRSPALRGLVEERRRASDSDAASLLRGARALLLPSFAEGFGMPLAEALALGVPAICSDIAAFREVGNSVPEYLDPLDGPSWRAAIRDYLEPTSPRRAAQIGRLASWQPPAWDSHFAVVQRALDGLQWQVAPPKRKRPG